MKSKTLKKDKVGFAGNQSSDMISGFLVFLLALPLSLGIAGASDFPPVYGLITAMVGGVIVTFFSGSELTIKGPAAGLIVIVAGSVAEFAHFAPAGVNASTYGWHLALGAIVVAGVLQVLFGIMKLGKLSDLFPLAAVHGMLAAIGIIIISKQLYILLGFNPMTTDGKPMVEPFELMIELKNTFMHIFAHKDVDIIGVVSLIIVFGWPVIPSNFLRRIPASVMVLLVTIPLAMLMNLHNVNDVTNAAGEVIKKGYKPLLDFDHGLFEIIGVNASFEGLNHMGLFLKYVIMFSLVGSLEALLTIKAIDFLDPMKRKSNSNKDLIAIGVGNIISGVLGGLPMICEVARSSSNVNNGAKTKWANFYHGVFILLFLVFAVYFSNLIPKAALAAMLIGVGWKLAHPREFGHMFKIGTDQFAIFVVTIIVTLTTDLLLGIFVGILLKMILHLARGAKLIHMFQSLVRTEDHIVFVRGVAVFSNFIKTKTKIIAMGTNKHVVVNLEECSFIDHSVMEALNVLEMEFKADGGMLELIGLERFRSARKKKHL